MKRIVLSIFALTLSLAAGAQEYLPDWQEGMLDIHTVATHKGECNFLVLPDGTTMMIDLGDQDADSKFTLPDASRTTVAWVVEYMKHFAGNSPSAGRLDYLYITHFHSDHFGADKKKAVAGEHGYKLTGVTELGEYMPVGKLVDRDYPNYNYPSAEYILTKCGKSMKDYIAWSRYQTSERGTRGEKFAVGSHRQFVLVHNPARYKGAFDIFNIAGYGFISNGKGRSVRKLTEDDPANFDENMFSCSILLRYGAFRYYTGGDTPGHTYFLSKYLGGKAVSEPKKANPNVRFRDFESQIADLVAPVTAMKANHHGCPDTCNPYFLWKMAPQVITVCGSWDKQPAPPTLERISDPHMPCAHKLFVTTDGPRKSIGEDLWNKCVFPVGHIVIRVTEGGANYQVFVLDATRSDWPVIYKSDKCSSVPPIF